MTRKLVYATHLDLVRIPVARLTFHGPYLAEQHNIPTLMQGGPVHLVEASQTPDYRMLRAIGLQDKINDAIHRRYAGGPQDGPYEPWIRA